MEGPSNSAHCMRQAVRYNSNFPFSVKLFDPAIFDRMSKKLLSNEYKNTYEFALDIRNNMSAGFGWLSTIVQGPDVSTYYTKLT